MKQFFLIALLFTFLKVFTQPVQNGSSGSVTIANARTINNLNFSIPRYQDTIAANTNLGVDTIGALIYTYGNQKFLIRKHNPKRWSEVGGDAVQRFNHDVVVNIPSGSLGAFSNGETIPLNGKRVDSLPDILATKCVAPSYVTPTAGITASPSNGSYEIGTNLGTITLSSTTGTAINNGGAFTTTTYYQNGSPLGSNTTTISSLTSTQSFYVNKAYTQGACIANNCGTIDCTGRINAGTITSNAIYFTPYPKRYWGYSSASAPTNGIVLASAGGNNELTTTKVKNSFNVVVSGTLQYVFYAYPASYGDLSSIIVGGFESIGAFAKTVLSVTNAQGYVQNYNVYTSNNQFTNTTITFNSVN